MAESCGLASTCCRTVSAGRGHFLFGQALDCTRHHLPYLASGQRLPFFPLWRELQVEKLLGVVANVYNSNPRDLEATLGPIVSSD